MNRETAELMCKITEDFYAAQADGFSRTRQGAWAGWQRCLESAQTAALYAREAPLTVLDVGCGNLRFERYLHDLMPAAQIECFAVDNCELLLPGEEVLANDFPYVRFQKLDVLGRLVHGADLAQALEAPACALSVCFGLMHHVPGRQYRTQLLDTLIRTTRPGGHVVASFWHFMESDELAQRAHDSHVRALQTLGIDPAQLDEGDWLLGWQNAQNTWRYCHHFTPDEVDELLADLPVYVDVVDRFQADGRTGSLNTYIVLKVS